MNITFVIGNGFDLGLGMRCRYGDFYGLYRNDSRYMTRNEYARKISRDAKKIIRTWADFEIAIGEPSTKLKAENSYLKYIQDFLSSLVKYLEEEEADLDFTGADTQHSIAKNIEHALQYFGSEVRLGNDVCQKLIESEENGEIDCNFLCFNYTSTLQTCLNAIPKGQLRALHRTYTLHEVQHVHGRIRAGLNYHNEPPILGVDNELQITNNEFRSFAPLRNKLIKPNCIPIEKRNKYCRTIHQSDLICIYGMSLGKTDTFWWREIGRWLKQDPKRQLVIYWFDESINVEQLHSTQWQDTVADCRSRFVSASPELGWQPDELNRIHVAINSNLLGCKIPRRKRK